MRSCCCPLKRSACPCWQSTIGLLLPPPPPPSTPPSLAPPPIPILSSTTLVSMLCHGMCTWAVLKFASLYPASNSASNCNDDMIKNEQCQLAAAVPLLAWCTASRMSCLSIRNHLSHWLPFHFCTGQPMLNAEILQAHLLCILM